MKTNRKGEIPIAGIVVLSIVAIMGVAGVVMYNSHVKRERIEAARRAEMARIEREKAEEAVRTQRLKEEEEAERKRREARLAREREEEARELAERERKHKAAKEEAERQRKLEAENKRRVAYRTAQGRFLAPLDMEGNAPTGEKTQSAKVGSKFWYVFASHASDKLIYEVEKISSSCLKVMELSLEADAREVDFMDFKRMMDNETFAYTSGGKVWLKCKKSPAGSYAIPEKGNDFCVASECLGRLHDMLVGFGTEFNEVRCRVTLRSDSGKTKVQLGVIGFGDSLPRNEIEKAMGKQIGKKVNVTVATGAGNIRKPKFKRTVVLYDGDMIKKGLDGVTKVPRQFKFLGTRVNGYRRYHSEAKARNDWQELYDEANRQEKQEQEAYAEYEAALAAEKSKVKQLKEAASRLSSDDEAIDSALAKCKLIVEVGKRKSTEKNK